MELKDITAEKFFERFTYTGDPDPGSKITMSVGAFAQCAIWLKIERRLVQLLEKR